MDLVAEAASYARTVHAGDVRKGTGEPYFEAHLAPVARIVEAAGGDEVQVAAAYLHDTAEDHGGEARLADLRDRFGAEVADIVRDLSDSLVDVEAGEHKAPWRERKQAFIETLDTTAIRSLEVAAADKLHNVGAMTSDWRTLGDAVWHRFTTADPADHLWYHGAVCRALARRIPGHPTVVALAAAVAELEAMVADRESGRPAPEQPI